VKGSRQLVIRKDAETTQLLPTILLISIVFVDVRVELANTSRTLGQLSASALGVADAVNFLPVAVEVVVASSSRVDHGLADRAALLGDVVVVEFLGQDGAAAQGGEADEEDTGFVLHGCCLAWVDNLVGWRC
jgi:hypothetical protein